MLNKTVYVQAEEAHTPGRREDHVGVFGGRGNGGDPALVAGHRAEVAEGFHGVGWCSRRRRRCRARCVLRFLPLQRTRARTP